MVYIKRMTSKDYQFAVRVTDTMNWNLVEKDFEFMTGLEPDGCFVVFQESERIGVATAISFGEVGWLGNVIVSEKHRIRGVGSMLVRHALEYLKDKCVETVGLYSYVDKVNFYRRLGFEYDAGFVVMKGKGSSSSVGIHLREANEGDVQDIIDLDGFYFGASRRKLLEPILLDPYNVCYVYKRDCGQLLGFVLAKVYDQIAEVGPLVCRQGYDSVAADLLKAALNRLEGFQVSLCIPEKESTLTNTLTRFGFVDDFKVVRMLHGNNPFTECIYIVESLERG